MRLTLPHDGRTMAVVARGASGIQVGGEIPAGPKGLIAAGVEIGRLRVYGRKRRQRAERAERAQPHLRAG